MNNSAALHADSITVGYDGHVILEDLLLSIQQGQITALIGPNCSGKSTLLKALARLLKPGCGAVYLDGSAIARMSTREVARRMAVLPQGPGAPAGLTVTELVEQGRYPHTGALRMLRHQDHKAIREALELTGMTPFAARMVDELSGGERQRVWIALALAQDTPILLLDEPTTFLDIGHQLEVLELVKRLNHERGMTLVLVLHDLNHAARYADRMIALDAGKIAADGPPAEVLTAQLLADVFHVHAHILTDPVTHQPVCMPYAYINGVSNHSSGERKTHETV